MKLSLLLSTQHAQSGLTNTHKRSCAIETNGQTGIKGTEQRGTVMVYRRRKRLPSQQILQLFMEVDVCATQMLTLRLRSHVTPPQLVRKDALVRVHKSKQ